MTDGRHVLRGLELRSALVLVLLARGAAGGGAMTVAQLAAALRAAGWDLDGRPGKTIADSLRWEVARGRVVRCGRGRYAAGTVAKATKHRMRRRVAATRNRVAASHSCGTVGQQPSP